jgi:hypothetical protein
MPLKPDRLARSLKLAQDSRSLYESKLDEKGVSADDRAKDPRWRALNATCSEIENRIRCAEELTARGAAADTEESSPADAE